ncbi:hypothetical protein WDW37_08445 [Bdellovibrionota bacterium FG-1]
MTNRQVQRKQKIATLLTLLGLATLLSACGSSAYPEGSGTGSAPGNQTTSPTPDTPVYTSATPTPTPAATSAVQVGTSDQTFSFVIDGTTPYTSPKVSTDSVLKVVVTAGDEQTLAGTGYTVGFNCEKFTITVLGQSTTAFVKRPNYTDAWLNYWGSDPCASAQESVTLDFSGRLAQGHNQVTIQVSNPMYDNCRTSYDVSRGGCPLSSLYTSGIHHTVGGNIDVQVNSLN